jgi:hypothetical protein
MTDTTIRSDRTPVMVTNPDNMTVALKLPEGDANKNKALDKAETLSVIYDALPPSAKKVMKEMCQRNDMAAIASYVEDTKVAARIATNMGLLTEVVVPGVPSLCTRAQSITL